jgi:hypothetical protein
MYDTCIKITPEFGYYAKIIPKYSIAKSGYVLCDYAIDNYKDTLKIVLIKNSLNKKDIKLPCSIGYLIMEKIIHYEMQEE